MLKLLALQDGRSMHREQAMDFLWPDLGPEAAWNNLRKNLHYLRAALGSAADEPIAVAGDVLRLAPAVALDVDEFQLKASEACASRTDVALYDEALALYGGDLLPEDLYEDWTESRREQLRTLYFRLLLEASQLHEIRGEAERAIERLTRLLELDASNEEAHRSLMCLYAASGSRRLALRQYLKCRTALEQELGVPPSEETEALYCRISEGRAAAPVSPPSRTDPIVGRETEMDLLRHKLREALAGRGSLAALLGEGGIGKSRLAEELAAYAHLAGTDVLWGRCHEGEGAPAYWPWTEILRSYIERHDPADIEKDMGAGAVHVSAVAPQLREVLPGISESAAPDSEQDRFRFFDSIAAFFKRVCAREPLLLVLEDLHWADAPSLLLLQFLARQIHQSRLLLLLTYRDSDPGRRQASIETLGELSREHPGHVIELSGLSPADVGRLISIATGHESPASLVNTIHEKTDGNPFYVGEVVRLLQAGNGAAIVDSAGLPVPRGVRDVIDRRVARLSDECRDLLTWASVCGREFDLDVLERVQKSSQPTQRSLEEAIGAQIIEESLASDRRHRFSHVLIRDVLYDHLRQPARADAHAQVGAALETSYARDLDSRLPELAHHFSQATGEAYSDKAIDYACRAAENAVNQFAYEEGVRLYRLALRVLDSSGRRDESRRCRLLLGLGDALRRAGDYKLAQTTLWEAGEIAERIGQPEQVACAALGFGGPWGDFETAATDRLVRILRRALNALGDQDSTLRARVMARLATALESLQPTADLAQQAVAMARRLEDRATLAYSLEALIYSTWGAPNVPERLAAATEIVEIAVHTDDIEMTLRGRDARIACLMELGDVTEAEGEMARYAQLAQEDRQPFHLWTIAVLRAAQALLLGRFTAAERLAAEALDIGRAGTGMAAESAYWAQLLQIKRETGQLHEIEHEFKHYVDLHPDWPYYRSLLILMMTDLESWADANAEFERAAAKDFSDLVHGGWPLTATHLAYACAKLGDAQRGALLYKLLSPLASYAIAQGGTANFGSASRYLGLLAGTIHRLDDAERHFKQAIDMNAGMRAWPWLAWTKHDYARVLIARSEQGDRDRASHLLSEALATAKDLGMSVLMRQAAELKREIAHQSSVHAG